MTEDERIAVGVLRGIVRREGERRSFPTNGFTVDVEPRSSGGTTAVIRRDPHQSEGLGKQTCHVGSDFKEISRSLSVERYVVRFTDEFARLHDRDRAIEATGCLAEMPPAWSIHAHVLTHSLLSHYAVDPADSVPPDGSYLSGIRSKLYKDLTKGVSRSDGTILKTSEMNHHRDRLRVRGLRVIDGGNVPISFTDVVPDNVVLNLETGHLPSTVVNAMTGMTLKAITDHPALAMAGDLRVTSAEAEGDTVTLRLGQRRMFLSPPPEGADTSWMTP